MINNKLYIAIGVLVVLLLGGGLFLATRKNGPESTSPAAKTQPTATTTSAMGTLKALLTGGASQSCSYSTPTQTGSVEGTVYVAGGKMRGDFTAKEASTTVSGHMIVVNNESYTWTDLSKQGIKMAINTSEAEASAGSENSNQSVDLNQNVSYHCSAWAEDASKFSLPTDITFTSFTVPSASGVPGNACAACNNLPAGSAQTACREQLHCQ